MTSDTPADDPAGTTAGREGASGPTPPPTSWPQPQPQWGGAPQQQWGQPQQQWGPPPGQQWGPPPGQQWGRAPETSGLAIGALACGIGVFILYITWVPALILGYMARRRIDESNGQLVGREMATVGIVLGYIGLGFTVIIIAIILAVVAASG